MSDTYGSTDPRNDDTIRDLGTVEPFPTGTGADGSRGTPSSSVAGTSGTGDTKDVAKDEVKATGAQAKEGARHVAEVGKDEVKNVAQETGQQAKELWQQTRSQLMDQSAQQQTKVAEGLRSLSQELSSMARSSDQQGVASDLAQQASQRMGDVAGWLDQRDPGSLVSEVKQFARQRPGAFLATAAVIGLIGGRLSRGLVAEHQDESGTAAPGVDSDIAPPSVDHSTSGYSAYGSATGTTGAAGDHPVTDPSSGAGDLGDRSPVTTSATGTGARADEYPR